MDDEKHEDESSKQASISASANKKTSAENSVSGRTLWDIVHSVLFSRSMWKFIALAVVIFVSLSAFGLAEFSWNKDGLTVRIGKSEHQIEDEIRQKRQSEQAALEREGRSKKEKFLTDQLQPFAGKWVGGFSANSVIRRACRFKQSHVFTLKIDDPSVGDLTGTGTFNRQGEYEVSMLPEHADSDYRRDSCLEYTKVPSIGSFRQDVDYEFSARFSENGESATLNLVKSDRCGSKCDEFTATIEMRPNGELIFLAPKHSGLDRQTKVRLHKK